MSHRAIGPQFDPEGEPGFEDKGQGYLWPYKMPTSGTTPGVEGLHLYRGITLAEDHTDPQKALGEILNTPDKATPYGEDVGFKEPGSTLGRHWTHDQDWAKNFFGNSNVVLEADHPGRKHVLDWEKDQKEASATVVHHDYIERSLPEVPIRAGSPMNIRAVHLYDESKGGWQRHPIEYRGKA